MNNLPHLIHHHHGVKSFGSQTIHQQLTRKQLDELVELNSDYLKEEYVIWLSRLINLFRGYVNLYINKLHPNADVDITQNEEPKLKYIEELRTFLFKLGDKFNNRKAAVLYHKMAHFQIKEVYDPQLLLDFLKIPKTRKYLRSKVATECKAQELVSSALPTVGILPAVAVTEEQVWFLVSSPLTTTGTGSNLHYPSRCTGQRDIAQAETNREEEVSHDVER